MGIESNIKASFRDVKIEMISLKNQILQIADSQNELKHLVYKLQEKLDKKSKKKK